jgi:hypothetical protein
MMYNTLPDYTAKFEGYILFEYIFNDCSFVHYLGDKGIIEVAIRVMKDPDV